jgi:hypothetical protein
MNKVGGYFSSAQFDFVWLCGWISSNACFNFPLPFPFPFPFSFSCFSRQVGGVLLCLNVR